MAELRYWPIDFPVVSTASKSDSALVAFFDQMVATGASVYVNKSWTLYGFARGERKVDFVWRGRLRRGSAKCWEVLLLDDGESYRLGPHFGLEESACVVIADFGDLRIVAERWLSGLPLKAILQGVTFWNKTDPSIPLEAAT